MQHHAVWIYINYQLLMHWLLFIHKILFPSTCFKPQVLIFRRIHLYMCSIWYCHSLWEFLVACRYTAWVRTDCRGKVVGGCLKTSTLSNFFPARCFFRWRNKWKSLGARSGLYGGWSNIWTFTFCVEKSYDRTHLAFGGTLDQRFHFKHISLKQRPFYHCQTSTAHR